MTITTTYGSWYNHTGSNASPEGDIADFMSGGDSDWNERMEESGATDKIAQDYRDAIRAALPGSVTLAGDEFIGPYYADDQDFDGYPTTDDGQLDIRAIVEGIDLGAIVESWDVDTEWTLDQVAEHLGVTPKTAYQAMWRAEVKPVGRQAGEGGRVGPSLYNMVEVRKAKELRPGQGTRTDLA